MDWKLFFTTFIAVFLAELGDKTQLATFSFAAGSRSKFTVFVAASCALILTSALGVLVATQLQKWLSPRVIKLISGGLFVAIGIWILVGVTSVDR